MLQEAQRKLQKTGLPMKTRNGYIQQSPLVATVASCVDQVNKLCRDFGLTPASRTRLTVEKEANPDTELWDLVSKPRLPRPDRPSTLQ